MTIGPVDEAQLLRATLRRLTSSLENEGFFPGSEKYAALQEALAVLRRPEHDQRSRPRHRQQQTSAGGSSAHHPLRRRTASLGRRRRTGFPQSVSSRKWFLSPHMTPSEVVQTALKAVLTAVEHEAREHFFYQGRAIFGPHLNVDALHRIAGEVEVRQELAVPA